MIQSKPTLKEYLFSYQNNKSVKGNRNVDQISFEERVKLIESKFDIIKNILKQNLHKNIFTNVCKEIDEAQMLVVTSIDKSRTICMGNDKGSIKTLDTSKNILSSQNPLRLSKQKKHHKPLSSSSKLQFSIPQNLSVKPLEPRLISQNMQNLLQPSQPLKNIVNTQTKSYGFENNSGMKMQLLLESIKRPVQPFYVIPPELKKEQDEDLLDIESMRHSVHTCLYEKLR